MTPESFRQLYLLNIALAAASGSEGDLREACDLAQQAFCDAIRSARTELEDALKEIYGELEEASSGPADPTIVACQKIARRILWNK